MAKCLFVFIILSAALTFIGGCSPAATEPDAPQLGIAVPFHDKCADTLRTFVDARGMVDYKRLRQERYELGLLLGELGKVDAGEYGSWSKEDRIAFWI
ncbi:MAG: hypothetical protein ACYTE3_12930, partial [Planctomycetota bacterium]